MPANQGKEWTFDTVAAAYEKIRPGYYKNIKQPEKYPEYSEEQAADRARIAEKYGFTDVQYALFTRTRTLSAGEYRALIGTYSDHVAMEEGIREEFFSKIEETINRHGGVISVFDTIDLQVTLSVSTVAVCLNPSSIRALAPRRSPWGEPGRGSLPPSIPPPTPAAPRRRPSSPGSVPG